MQFLFFEMMKLGSASDALVFGFAFLFGFEFFLRLCGVGHVDREFDGFDRCLRSKVVLARLETEFPPVEVHRRELLQGAAGHVDVQRLRLVNKRAAVRRELQDTLLLDLPHRLVQFLHVRRDFLNLLDGTVVGYKLGLHLWIP